jgi:hypothetical protein
MALDLAVLADECVFLHLDEGPDFCVIVNGASIQVDEIGKFDIFPELDIIRNGEIFHNVIARPFF